MVLQIGKSNLILKLLRRRPVFLSHFRSKTHKKSEYLEYHKSIIGGREIVGFGINGEPNYADRSDFPFPAIRFREPSAEILAIREKEKGDWRLLTVEEKKALYRYSYCQTFAEFNAITSEWMAVVGWTLILVSCGVFLYILQKKFVFGELPDTFSPIRKQAQLARMIDMQVNPIQGLSSNWDYEKNDWKVKKWNTPPNPFPPHGCYNHRDIEG